MEIRNGNFVVISRMYFLSAVMISLFGGNRGPKRKIDIIKDFFSDQDNENRNERKDNLVEILESLDPERLDLLLKAFLRCGIECNSDFNCIFLEKDIFMSADKGDKIRESQYNINYYNITIISYKHMYKKVIYKHNSRTTFLYILFSEEPNEDQLLHIIMLRSTLL